MGLPLIHMNMRVRIHMREEHLDIWYRSTRLIYRLHCPWFEPQTHWQWSIGAGSGPYADDHFIKEMVFTSSHSPVDVGAVELRLSLNDQDYAPAADFHYYAEPILSLVEPPTGPIAGGTFVTVSGSSSSETQPSAMSAARRVLQRGSRVSKSSVKTAT